MKQKYFAHETAVIDENCQIGEGTKIWHFSHIMTGCVIGTNCNIGQNVVISPEVVLGNNVKVQNNVSVYTGVTCEDDVFLGPSCVFTTVVCGHDIGAYAFIGAGAVVTKHVPDYALLVGNPARQLGWMSEYGHRLYFDAEGIAECPESHEKYQLKDGKLFKI